MADVSGAAGFEEAFGGLLERAYALSNEALSLTDSLLPDGMTFATMPVPGLLRDPRLGGMLRCAQDPDAAGAVLDGGKDMYLGAVEEVGGEEVQRQDPQPWERRNSAQPGRRGAVPGRSRRS